MFLSHRMGEQCLAQIYFDGFLLGASDQRFKRCAVFDPNQGAERLSILACDRSPVHPALAKREVGNDMSIKSILTVYDGCDGAAGRLDRVIEMAQAHDAHLTVYCFELDPSYPPQIYVGEVASVYAGIIADAQARLVQTVADVTAQLTRSGVAFEVLEQFCASERVARDMSEYGRFSDVIVLHDPKGMPLEETLVRVLEGSLFGTDMPTMVLPKTHAGPVGKRIHFAWNGGAEAMRALRAAMPMIYAAGQIEIIIVDGSPTEVPGIRVAQFLERHGITVTIIPITSDGRNVAQAIGDHVKTSGADLLVMGAYGHSRLREFFLGGATRDMLANLPAPVIMTH